MLNQASTSAAHAARHPLASRMAVIAAFSHNITVGCLFGTFSVLMMSVEGRLGVSRELSTLGIPVVTTCNALLAPVAGMLAAKYSLRLLFTLGAVLSTLGYATLALTHSYVFYLLAYGLFLGPGMTFSGVVLPSTLVTRWFNEGRGKVLGMVHIPIVITIVPVLSSVLLTRLGAPVVYALAAVFVGVILIPLSLGAVDYPPGAASTDAKEPALTAASVATISTWQILLSPRFWAFAVSSAVIITGIVVLNTHMIPMASVWGISATAAATLSSVTALAGIPGSVIWGWVADKIGGGPALTICALSCGLLWALLLVNPHYPAALAIVGLLGMCGIGNIPLMGMALSQTFGRHNFSRAYGLSTMMTLPFTFVGVQAASTIFVKTGNYVLVTLVMVAAFVLVSPLPFLARNRKAAVAA